MFKKYVDRAPIRYKLIAEFEEVSKQRNALIQFERDGGNLATFITTALDKEYMRLKQEIKKYS